MAQSLDEALNRKGTKTLRGFFIAVLALFGLWALGLLFGIIALPFKTVQNATVVANRIISPDNMLEQYKWFHDTDAALKAFPAQIKAARMNLEFAKANNPDYAQSRMTELTGITQVCESWVGQYNSRSQRLDAGFFRNPERFLPVSTSSWEPLPPSYDLSYCEGTPTP